MKKNGNKKDSATLLYRHGIQYPGHIKLEEILTWCEDNLSQGSWDFFNDVPSKTGLTLLMVFRFAKEEDKILFNMVWT